MKIENWMDRNCTSLKGKTICITGSTGGLAKKFTEKLAFLGADLIFANRNKEKSEKQKQELIKKYPDIKIKIMLVDMFNMDSVKLFVCKLKQQHIDILIINSAVYNVPRKKSSAGYDNVFQINFVSPYFIIKNMLSNLRKIKNAKVVVIGSIAYNYSKANFDDIEFLKNAKQSKIYGNSKRFLMFSLKKLFLDQDVKLSIVHPGVTLTNMTNHYPKAINWLVKLGIKLVFPSPEKACLSVLSGVFDETNFDEWIGPAKFNIWGYPKKQKLKIDQKEADKFFEIAEDIYKKVSK